MTRTPKRGPLPQEPPSILIPEKKKSMSGHQSATMLEDEYLTPPEILRPLGKFDLDPCAPVYPPWKTAKRHFHVNQDGLSQKWKGRVWLNPPFGRVAPAWLARMAQHANGIALIPARTETDYFFRYVWECPTASGVLFLRSRPHFHVATDRIIKGKRYKAGDRLPYNSGAPICLIAYDGPKNGFTQNQDTLANCGLGKYIPL